jgi:hypothetical protein
MEPIVVARLWVSQPFEKQGRTIVAAVETGQLPAVPAAAGAAALAALAGFSTTW